MHTWKSKILATSVGIALSLGFLLPLLPASAAATTSLTVTKPAGYVPYGDGVWYRNHLVLKTGNQIKLLNQSGNEMLAFTIPTPVSSSEFTPLRVGFDSATGRLFYATSLYVPQASPTTLWYLDVDLLIDNIDNSAVRSTIQPVKIFEGFGSECSAVAGGIAFRPASSPRPEELYFGCSNGNDVAKNKLYKISIPSSGVLNTATVVANGSHTYSFYDLEYRPQDDMLFAVMRNGENGTPSFVAKIRPSGALPVTPATLINPSAGSGGITGIEIDGGGSIFYTSYEFSTASFSGYQITQEAPVAVSEGLYKYPIQSTDYYYSHDLILVEGSQAAGGVIGYQTNGHGGLLKITGTPASSASTIPYTVTFNSNYGTSSSTIQEGNASTPLTLNPFIRPGYSFSGWNEAANGSSTPFVDGASYSFNANLTLYAQWSLNTYNLTFDSQGGSAVTATTFDVANSVTAPSEPTRNGYTFAGWATTPSGTAVEFPYSPAAADLTLHAKWSPIVYNLAFDTQGGSVVSPSIFDLDAPLAQPQTPIRSGYTFAGWATTPSGTAVTFPYQASAGNLTLYAQWSLNTYNLTFDSQGGSAVTATTFDVANSVAAPSEPTRNGYTFAGWATTPSGTAVGFPYSPLPGDLTLHALWQSDVSITPISGPLITSFSSRTLDPCTPKSIIITGTRLSGVSAATVQGKNVNVLENTDTKLVLGFPKGLTPAKYVDLVINSSSGSLTHQDAFDIPESSCALGLFTHTWTKIQSDGKTVKMYAKDPVGDGKIQFFVDGKEIAWVNAVDESDPKLSFASSSPYLVRSVTLHEGKNRFEIKVDGVRVWRATYVPKG